MQLDSQLICRGAHCGTVRVPTQRTTARVLVLAPRGGSTGAWGDRARSVATALPFRFRTVRCCAVLLVALRFGTVLVLTVLVLADPSTVSSACERPLRSDK